MIDTAKRPVSENALIKRINRKLKLQDQALRKARSERVRLDLGQYFIVDFRRNLSLDTNINIEEFGREIGVLAPREVLAREQ